MKKLWWWAWRGLFGLVVIGALAASAVYLTSARKFARHYEVTVPPVVVKSGVDGISRGQHLATIRGCVDCHGEDMGGAKVVDDGAMGRVYGPNLTAGQGGLAAVLTNADWVRSVRHGLRRDGGPLIVMPAKDYTGLSDDDLGAIIAYIQSCPPVDRVNPPIKPGPVMRALVTLGKMRLSAEVIDHTRVQSIAPILPTATPEYGKYLASTCSGCHNPHFSGGKIMEGPPSWPPSSNLTGGPGSSVSGWNENDFVKALRTGVDRDGKVINPVMPREFGQMSDLELKALWSYIQTLPAAPFGEKPTSI